MYVCARKMDRLSVFVIILVISTANGQMYEGQSCTTLSSGESVPGVCVNISKCDSAIEDIKKRRRPVLCSFDGMEAIVCCKDFHPNSAGYATTAAPPPSSTESHIGNSDTYDYEYADRFSGGCQPLPSSLTKKKNGRKAWDKCIEYQERYVFPCEKSASLAGTTNRANHCGHSVVDLVLGGANAQRTEFPHMALVGYGPDPESAQWLCGGSIISERFILTAGHCTYSREFGDATYVRVRVHKRSDPLNPTENVYKVSRVIKHPMYNPPHKYNDIALIETDKSIKLDRYTVPACLHVGNTVKVERALATGWGNTEYKGKVADILQKVILQKFDTADCRAKYPAERLMKQGFNATSQICYGDKTMSKDTCQGDSGGPLQIPNHEISCMYTILGVTSFGKACGFIAQPGIYTKVDTFTPWIESIVWP